MHGVTCGPQFNKKALSLHRQDEVQFYTTQWGNSRTLYCIYRLLTALFVWAWLIYFWAYDVRTHIPYVYLTNIAEVWLAIYVLLSLVVAIFGKIKERHEKWGKALSPHIIGFLWFLQTTAYFTTFFVSIFYWIFFYNKDHRLLDYHKHITTAILCIVDIFVVANDVRFLHAIYNIPVCAGYILLTLIVHWAGVTHQVYPQLDWENGVVLAAILGAVCTLVVTWVIQLFSFTLYATKKAIYNYALGGVTNDHVTQVDDIEIGV